jgi:hypothetical protein
MLPDKKFVDPVDINCFSLIKFVQDQESVRIRQFELGLDKII